MSLIQYVDQELISIPVYYKLKKTKHGGRKIIILDEKTADKMLEDETQKAEVRILNTKWSAANWGTQKKIIAECTVNDASKSDTFNHEKYRDMRIQSCLKWWDEKDDLGNNIPVTPEAICKLPSDIVIDMYYRFENAVRPSQEELGN